MNNHLLFKISYFLLLFCYLKGHCYYCKHKRNDKYNHFFAMVIYFTVEKKWQRIREYFGIFLLSKCLSECC